jgi:hypothetical protein
MRATTLLAAAAAAPVVLAVPVPEPQNLVSGLLSSVGQVVSNLGTVLDAIPAIIGDLGTLEQATETVLEAIGNGTIAGTDVPAAVSSLFLAVQPTAVAPTSIAEATAAIAQQYGLTSSQAPTDQTSEGLVTNILGLVLNTLTVGDLATIISGAVSIPIIHSRRFKLTRESHLP